MGNEEYVKLMLEETRFYNSLLVPHQLRDFLPHFLETWLRNCAFTIVIYFLGTLLCLNSWKRYSSKGSMSLIKSQMRLSSKSMALGLFLPSGMEHMVIKGWTKCYPRLSDVGLLAYVCHLIMYLTFLEFATYWAHRIHHDIRIIYKYVHCVHHLYRKEDTLTPFAGFATHPLETVIMGLPHVIAILIVPTHFTTHLVLLLLQSIWALIIHDRSSFLDYWPLMNARYHTIHHTSAYYNFGTFTIWMDQLFGTLRLPNSQFDCNKDE